MWTQALIIVGLVLALISQVQSRGRSLIAWAVIAIAAALLIGGGLPDM
jgi:hypothetical protein